MSSVPATGPQRVPLAHTKVRIALWDNARFAMIALIVINHVISTVRTNTDLAFGIYTWPFLVHMPVLFLIAGLFAKTAVTPKSIRAVIQLLLAWLIWEGIWVAIRYFLADEAMKETFLISPAWTLWFLVSLATMRILLPYVVRLKRPLLYSTAVALLAGLSTSIGVDFSVSRTLCFMPFFVAGWVVRERGWFDRSWFLRPRFSLRIIAWTVLAAVGAVFAVPGLRDFWRVDTWLRWRSAYETLMSDAPIGSFTPDNWWQMAAVGIAVRALLIAVGAALALAILLVVPRGHSLISEWGTQTLYVYLLHAPVVWVLRETGVVDAVGGLGWPGVLLLVAMGLLIAIVLSTKWVSAVTWPVIEPLSRRPVPA
ncbi:MAG: acyltransferase family protein [Leucobacter sp.]